MMEQQLVAVGIVEERHVADTAVEDVFEGNTARFERRARGGEIRAAERDGMRVHLEGQVAGP
jgi:hypothetical protein